MRMQQRGDTAFILQHLTGHKKETTATTDDLVGCKLTLLDRRAGKLRRRCTIPTATFSYSTSHTTQTLVVGVGRSVLGNRLRRLVRRRRHLRLLPPFPLDLEGGGGEGPEEPGRGLEGELPGGRAVGGDLVQGDPHQQLLGLHPRQLLDLGLLHHGGDLGGVRHPLPYLLEAVLHLLLLLQPHEAGLLHVPALDDVPQGEQTAGEAHLLQ
ncbi:unnamed protein product [Musa acuminata var. zebrina]